MTALTGMVKCRSRTSAGTCRAEGVSTPCLDSFSSIHEVNLFVVRIPRRIPFDSRRVASCPLESSVPQKDICTPKRKDRSQRGFCRVVTGPEPSGQVILSQWRRRESNPLVQSRNSLIARRLWNMLQDVGVSWEWNDDANRQPMALGHEELAE